MNILSYHTKSGNYNPIYKNKYIGKSLPHYRSGWQLKAFISIDKNPKITKWSSQAIVIPYLDSTRNYSSHQYVVDLYFQIIDANKNKQVWLIQIKPYNQSVTPSPSKRKSQQKLLQQQLIVENNKCKWKAAIAFCKARGWHFGIWTQRGINQMC